MSLVTAYEVLKYSTAGRDYPTAQFCELIPQIEQEFARECLGKELYEYFLSKLEPYPIAATEYDSGSTYATGDIVIRNGCLFVSTASLNSTDPMQAGSNWEQFERFNDASVQDFWVKYLRRLLALKVYLSSLTFTTWKSGGGGLTIATGDGAGFRAATKSEIADMKTNLIFEIERTTKNMLEWLNSNWKTAGFPAFGICNSGCDTPQKRGVRRWNFKY